ncbi:hypothetical protein OROHE_000091 [Orobanche hederae]
MWISNVESIHRHSLIVGLDIKWRPSFNRYINNTTSMLQLCIGGRCLIFQLVHSPSIPKSLTDFLTNPNCTFIGIGIDSDLEKLQEDYEFGFNTNMINVRGLAADKYGQSYLKRDRLKGLAKAVLDKDVEKPKRITMSRWDYQWLTPAQMQMINKYRDVGSILVRPTRIWLRQNIRMVSPARGLCVRFFRHHYAFLR